MQEQKPLIINGVSGYLALPPSVVTAGVTSGLQSKFTTAYSLNTSDIKSYDPNGMPLQALCSYFARVTITIFDLEYVTQFYTIVPLYYLDLDYGKEITNEAKISHQCAKLRALSNTQVQVADKMEQEIRESSLIETLRSHALQFWKSNGYHPTWTNPVPAPLIKIENVQLFATERIELSIDPKQSDSVSNA